MVEFGSASMGSRTAHPYRDLAVIDARAPRFNQAVIGGLALAGVITGWWGLFALAALQLTLGLALGRRWCLPCVFYFEVVQPRIGEGPLEDSRPPRFANQVGATLLWAGALLGAVGFPRSGAVLGGMVAALALLAAVTGVCTGCAIYRVAARFRGLRARRLDRIDLAELGVATDRPVVIEFMHPLCSGCSALAERLRREGRDPVLVDVSRRSDLARKYGVSVVPLAFEVAKDGSVLGTVAG